MNLPNPLSSVQTVKIVQTNLPWFARYLDMNKLIIHHPVPLVNSIVGRVHLSCPKASEYSIAPTALFSE